LQNSWGANKQQSLERVCSGIERMSAGIAKEKSAVFNEDLENV
jgi:hypothetical protein